MTAKKVTDDVAIHEPVLTDVSTLTPHPWNYRQHPADQMVHLEASLRENGMYRNVVTAEDGTILAGHGVVQAAQNVGLAQVPVIRLPIKPDDARALKILTGDNELLHMGVVDDRALTTLLEEIRASDPLAGLIGTGFDDAMLANLMFVTRREEEIRSMDAAAQWVGLPAFEAAGPRIVMIVQFDDEAARDEAATKLGLSTFKKNRDTWSTWYPARSNADMMALMWDDGEDVEDGDGDEAEDAEASA